MLTTDSMSAHPTIRLKAKEGRRLRSGAPWAFSNEIEMSAAAKALPPGSLVNVQGDDGRPYGTFYFNPNSLIALRRLDEAPDIVPDQGFFAARIARAMALRETLCAEPYYRLVNAEGDHLPGLVIDRFGDAYVVQITTAGMERLREPLLAALAAPRLVLRGDAPARALEGLPLAIEGDLGRVAVQESGIRYFADLASGQKTGWYYDQRDNRAFIAALAKDKSVLDAYCHSGGFALAAAKAGAKEVVALDSSQPALELGEQSAAANGLTARFVKCDVFEELERLATSQEVFDIVIADPPPFVKARKDLEPGAKAYRKLARLAARATARDGIVLLASCSYNIGAERFAQECALGIERAGRKARLIRQAGAGPDHPVHPMLPESAYLKVLVYALD